MPDDPSRSIGDDENESLVRELRATASRVDPVPSALKAAAKAGLSWRTVDAELAELAFDSLVDDPAGALVRAEQGARLLSFEASSLAIELEVVVAGARRHLVGQLDPPQAAEVEVRHPRGTRTVDADQLGRFAAEVSAGPVSLRCRAGAAPPGAAVVTAWVSV
ncbi:MAG TPA: hypothetical protein VFA46_09345 [Actinomycetes bacterium]|jgi:hypothetical protein|nr:hypothetical protein [Actinomycetes bacterium]